MVVVVGACVDVVVVAGMVEPGFVDMGMRAGVEGADARWPGHRHRLACLRLEV